MIAYPRVALKSVVSIGPPVECQLGVVCFLLLASADNDRQRAVAEGSDNW